MFYCDRSGRPLWPQPRAVDFRPLMQHCAAELALTQVMSARADCTQPPAPVGPPPLHVAPPVKPRVPAPAPEPKRAPADGEAAVAEIASEEDDWFLDAITDPDPGATLRRGCAPLDDRGRRGRRRPRPAGRGRRHLLPEGGLASMPRSPLSWMPNGPSISTGKWVTAIRSYSCNEHAPRNTVSTLGPFLIICTKRQES